jgi:protein subunit release factor B
MKLRTTKLTSPGVLNRTKADFTVTHIRGSGPGGQHRNKVSTGVRIVDKISGLSAEATNSKSQKTNIETAFRKLAKNILAYYENEQMGELSYKELAKNAERIRTYHEKRGQVKDHRTGEVRDFKGVLDGDIEGLGWPT